MKKPLLLSIFLCLLITNAFSQRPGRIIESVVIEPKWDNWQDPPENIEVDAIRNRGINITNLVPLNSRVGHFTFVTGFGISNSNIFTDAKSRSWNFDTAGRVMQEIPDTVTFRKNKISLTYLEIPFQVIIRPDTSNMRPFRITLGFSGGVLIDSKSKIKDDDHTHKLKKLDPVYLWKYGPYVRIGKGRWHLFGSYSLSPVFDSPGVNTRLYSVGITFSGL